MRGWRGVQLLCNEFVALPKDCLIFRQVTIEMTFASVNDGYIMISEIKGKYFIFHMSKMCSNNFLEPWNIFLVIKITTKCTDSLVFRRRVIITFWKNIFLDGRVAKELRTERQISFSVTCSCAEAGLYMLNGAPVHTTFHYVPVWMDIDWNICFTNSFLSDLLSSCIFSFSKFNGLTFASP